MLCNASGRSRPGSGDCLSELITPRNLFTVCSRLFISSLICSIPGQLRLLQSASCSWIFSFIACSDCPISSCSSLEILSRSCSRCCTSCSSSSSLLEDSSCNLLNEDWFSWSAWASESVIRRRSSLTRATSVILLSGQSGYFPFEMYSKIRDPAPPSC